jgi:rhodanese-related sulfurtransferase
VFRDGIPAWVRAGYPLNTEKALPKIDIPSINTRQLKEIIDEVHVVDIRPESLYEMGWIAGSQKIPLTLFPQRYTEIPKEKTIVLIDHVAKQVLMAGRFLKTKGYEKVLRLQGGLMAWVSQGYPLEK